MFRILKEDCGFIIADLDGTGFGLRLCIDELFVNLIRAGEMGGILDTILNRLAGYIEKRVKLARQVRGAMVYPIAIFCVAIIVVVVMLAWVIPSFKGMFAEFGGEIFL